MHFWPEMPYVCCCCLQGEPKSSATGSSARELDLPGQLRSLEVQDWAQYLAGGLNAPDLISRVALLPQVCRHGCADVMVCSPPVLCCAARYV
jgi:hypothetical protein